MLKIMKGVCAAALWMALVPEASAQFCIPFLTCPSPDNTPPTVSITSPASGATVSGTITVTANAADNRGVAGVQFRLDGINAGAEDTTAPYSVSWDTTTASDGSHTITAVARDAAGNRTTSDPVTVTVANGTDNTPPTVSITSPASGTTVSGTITVTASAADNQGVAGVQFRLDGVDGGAEDTTAPYSVSWDTTTASNGSHTLTAVARDAAGNRTTSSPVTVTVANDVAPPPATTRRYEETNASVSYGVGWNRRDDNLHGTGWFTWSGGSAAESMTPGARATFAFTGTSVAWIGMRGLDSGIARVFLDGVFVSEVDMFARSYELHVPVFTASGLSNGTHTLTIEATGMKNGDAQAAQSAQAVVVIDAFDVPAPVVSQLQDTDPDMTYSAGWTRWENTKPWSGWYATISSTPGARATLPFIGTSISWLGYRGPDAGIANVYLDGSFAGEVDLYDPDEHVQAVLFTSPPLADANHTLTIEATGRKNAASRDAWVAVDAFAVTTLGRRFEETDPSISYAGSWTQGNFNRAWSMRTVAVSGEPGARAAFTFSGTSASWIGTRKSTTGIARVYVDGLFVTEIDTYSATDGLQDTVFRVSDLARGTHTLTIEATGRKNPAASSAYVVIDAFDARP